MRHPLRLWPLLLTAGVAGSLVTVLAAGQPASAATPTVAGAFVPVPTRNVLDTRSGLGGVAKTAVPAGGKLTFVVAGVPAGSVVALHVVETSSTASGWLAAWPNTGAEAASSLVAFTKGQVLSNLGLVQVGSDGKVSIRNHSVGALGVAADISGYYLKSDLPVPHASTSRYVRNITGAASDVTTMAAEGQADAAAGSTFVLLDIGAQLNNKTGVALTTTGTQITYGQLVSAVQGYLDGFGSVSAATVAVGTNNDANDWTNYTAQLRGADWAKLVVNALRPAPGVAVIGASDIEGGFFSTEAEAEAWEAAYLTAATTKKITFNGSADGCPTTYGSTDQTCSYGWTQAQYYQLAGGLNPTQIEALPQIYHGVQATQWANIDATGGKGITFAGSLTENAACGSSCSLAPSQGWASLYHSLSEIGMTPNLPVATDLRADS